MTENEYMRALITAAGGDPDKLPDNLKSSYYKCLIDCLNNGGGSGEYTQPEWGYKEGYCLPEMEVTLALNEELGMVIGVIDNSLFETSLIPYQEYTVIYGDQEYVCAFTGMYLGNMVIAGGEDTGEPFMLLVENDICGLIPTNQTPGTVKFGIRGEICKAIESKFAPEIPYLDLVDLGFGTVDSINSTTITYDKKYYHENIKPQLGKANIKVKIHLSYKAQAFFTSYGHDAIFSENREHEIILHASESDNQYAHAYYTVLGYSILGVKFTSTDARVALHPFDLSAFVLDGEFTY